MEKEGRCFRFARESSNADPASSSFAFQLSLNSGEIIAHKSSHGIVISHISHLPYQTLHMLESKESDSASQFNRPLLDVLSLNSSSLIEEGLLKSSETTVEDSGGIDEVEDFSASLAHSLKANNASWLMITSSSSSSASLSRHHSESSLARYLSPLLEKHNVHVYISSSPSKHSKVRTVLHYIFRTHSHTYSHPGISFK